MERPGERRAAGEAAVRIDRWLVAARVFKTRTHAAGACAVGRVEVDGVRAKAHRLIRIGSTVKVSTARGRRVLEVTALAQRRLPAPAARELYVDESPAPPRSASNLPPPGRRERGSGRPTKRQRREIDRLR